MILYRCSENDGFWKIENSVTCNASISSDIILTIQYTSIPEVQVDISI
jgi:hypothetical protein